jgi:hypothetical protein
MEVESEVKLEKDAPFYLTTVAQFKEEAVTEESLIFKTQKDDGSDDEWIVYTSSPKNSLITIIANNNTPTTHKIKEKPLFDKIVSYATIAHQHGSVYTFYVAVKIAKKYPLGKDTYSIQKIDFDPTGNSLVPTELFTHNSPIAHIGIIKKDGKNYLVVGSLYPSIKIHNLTDFNSEPIKPLHNRFLLGCIDNTIIYAKKNSPPRTGLTRWLESRKIDQPFDCTLYYTTDPFNKDAGKPLKDNDEKILSLPINTKNYPVISEQHKNTLVFINDEYNHYFVTNTPNMFAYRTQVFIFDKDSWQKRKLEDLIHANAKMLAKAIKKQITLESFKQFVYENRNNNFMQKEIATKNHYNDQETYIYIKSLTAFMQWIIKSFFAQNTLIDDGLAIHITGKIAGTFIYNSRTQTAGEDWGKASSYVEAYNKDKIAINAQTIHEANTYLELQKKFSAQLFENITNITSGTNYAYFLSKDKYPPSQQLKKAVPVNKDYSVLYTDKKILILDNQTDKKTVYDLAVNYPNISINHITFVNDTMYLLTNEELYVIKIPEKSIEKPSFAEELITEFIEKAKKEMQTEAEIKEKSKILQQEKSVPTVEKTPLSSESIVKSSRSDQEKSNLIDQIIKEIKSKKFIDSIKNDILQTNIFKINDQNVVDLPKTAARLDGAVTDLFKDYYLWPIIEKNLISLLENMNTFTTQEILDIKSKRRPSFDASYTLLKEIEGMTVYGALKDKVIHEWNQLTEVAQQNLDRRFGTLYTKYSESKNNENLAIIKYLSYCLALEEEQIPLLQKREKEGFFGKTKETIFENKTYMQYIKELCLKNANNIQSLFKFDQWDKQGLMNLL